MKEAEAQERTPQEQWDIIKHRLKKVIKCFGVRHAHDCKTRLRVLQSNRNAFLRTKLSAEECLRVLPPVENEIVGLQRSTVETLGLRAGQQWREQGVTSIQYIKSCIRQRQSFERIPALREYPEMDPSSEPLSMLRSVSTFYRSRLRQ